MRTKLAQMIEEAFEDCISYGIGRSVDQASRTEVSAEWGENEEDIEITIYEHSIIRFSYVEKVEQ